jgi:hypothetical protein
MFSTNPTSLKRGIFIQSNTVPSLASGECELLGGLPESIRDLRLAASVCAFRHKWRDATG